MRCSKLSLPVLCSLAVIRRVGGANSCQGRFCEGCVANLPAELRAVSRWAQAAEQRNAAGSQERRPKPPRSGAREQREQLSIFQDHGELVRHANAAHWPSAGPEQINTIKKWIDQGADWPDSLANEVELPPLNPKAIAMVDALHAGDLKGFMKSAAQYLVAF